MKEVKGFRFLVFAKIQNLKPKTFLFTFHLLIAALPTSRI